jgi:integration host factor subunit beta
MARFDFSSRQRGDGTMTKQPTLTKADLIEEVLRVTELARRESETIVETIFESIIGALQKGEKIEIRGFGSFRTRQRRGRVGRNPKTGEKVEVPAKKIPFFKPSKELKDFVNTADGASASVSAPTSN